MLHMIGHMIFGLIIGAIARLVMPGPNPRGLIATMLLGLVGAWLGGLLGRALGLYPPGHPAGFFMAFVGAVIVLVIYHYAVGGRRRYAESAPGRTAVVRTASDAPCRDVYWHPAYDRT
jgi:uncharacterized membrane protein YeaQ/YmgE (transglycosylase-associated protein family)